MTQLTEHLIPCRRRTRTLAKMGLPHVALWFCACNFFAISLFSQGSNLTLSNQNLASGTYQAGVSITAGPSLVIGGSSNVAFNAGNTIYLMRGFQTKTGDAFNASIVVFTPPSITTSSLPNGVVGMFYTQTLTAANGVTPYTWSLANGTTLPSWLNLDQSTGVLSGTPLATASYNFTVMVTDFINQTSNPQPLSLTIVPVQPDFSLAISPSSATVSTGLSYPYTVALTCLNGFAGPVTLSAPTAPSGVTAVYANGTRILTCISGPSHTHM